MTVAELIVFLQQIEDQSLPVEIVVQVDDYEVRSLDFVETYPCGGVYSGPVVSLS
jgi:hypothetical protein